MNRILLLTKYIESNYNKLALYELIEIQKEIDLLKIKNER